MRSRLGCLFVVLGMILASQARAQVDATLKLGDTFDGAVISNIDEDVVLFDALAASKITVSVKGKQGFRPTLRIVDTLTGAELFPGAFLSGIGSTKVELTSFSIPKLSRYALLISGFEDAVGKYGVTTSVKLGSGVNTFHATASLAAAATTEIAVAAIADAKITLTVTPKNGSAAKPVINEIDGPDDSIDLSKYLKKKGKSVLASKVPVGKLGVYVFTIGNVGGQGDLDVKVKVTVPKGGSKKKEPVEPTTPGSVTGALTVPPLLGIPEIAGPNDTVATAQFCGSLSAGALVRMQGTIDSAADLDSYRIEVGAKMKLQVMLLHDVVGDDFDLGVFSVAAGAYLAPTFETANEPEMGTVELPAAGTYMLVVWPYTGTGKYILTALGMSGSLAASNDPPAPPPAAARERPAVASPQALLELDRDFAPNEFIVKLGDAKADRRDFAARNGLDLRIESPAGPFVVQIRAVSGDPATAKRATVLEKERIRTLPEVEYAELNYRHFPQALPNDPLFTYQWHYGTIKLPQAWDLTKGSQNIIVAVLDTGITAHPDLVPRNSGTGYDFISSAQNGGDGNGIDSDPTDIGDQSQQGKSTWHGSHVAGTIGAATNNGNGVSGVDWFCRVMSVRVLGLQGGDTFDIAEACRYTGRLPNASGVIPPQRANVINMSLGGGAPSQTMQDAVLAVRAQGVTVIAAAGNSSTSQPSYPASYNGVISVSAVDPAGNLASYSNYGSLIDVAAPGGESQFDLTGDGYGDGVLSTVVDENQNAYSYDFKDGTSMACPHVAGVAALILSVNPNLTPDQVEAVLKATAVDLGPAGPDTFFGAGMIDAFAAVKAAAQTNTPQLTPSTQLLDFGGVATQLGFTIANTGNGTLSWTATDSETQGGNWLTLSSGAGNATTVAPSQLTATVNRSGLAVGSYTATISLASNGGQAQIQVKMTVASAPAQPQISISTNALDFGSTLTQTTFGVSNAGSGSLVFTLADVETPAINWLSLSSPGSTLGGGQTQNITATANRALLGPGAYSATIQANSNGGNAVIQVSLTVPPPSSPNLSLSAQLLDYSTNASQLTVSVSNTGGGTLTFNAVDTELDGSGWLSVTPGNGTAPATLTVTVNRSGLVEGHYDGKVVVTSNGGNATIVVSMDVSLVQATPIALGTVYVVAVRPETFTTAANALLPATGGNWQMLGVPIGGYVVFAGPDLDNDGFLCGPGEPCGGFPTLVDPLLILVAPGLFTNFVNFSVNADTALPASFGPWFDLPAKGFPIAGN